MTGEVIYSVFVSSTYDDLREERAEVQKALLKLHCMPIGMELFGSADEETWAFIKRQIASCDYYVVVIADRYGSTASDGLSYTEKEYDYAKQIGTPVLAFVHRDRGAIARDKTEADPEKRWRLDAFIAKVRRSPVSDFNSPHELATNVTVSFVNLRDRQPATGFIRADQAADLRKYAALLEENARLRAEVAGLKNASALAMNASGRVPIRIRIGVTQTQWGKLDPNERDRQQSLTWGEIFTIVAESIVLASDDEDIVAQTIASRAAGSLEKGQYARFGDGKSVRVADSPQFKQIKMKLFGWGLVDFQIRSSALLDGGVSYTAWALTEYGQRQYGLLTESPATHETAT